MKFTVAMDGPAAAGKGTIARALSDHFGFLHLDTGLLYRAVGKKVLDTGRALSEAEVATLAEALDVSDVDETVLRTSKIAQAASHVAMMAPVRAVLVDFQRACAGREGGAILDGRDIGTVVCPNADIKLFVTASAEVRAERRYHELLQRGEDVTLLEVLTAVKIRDKRDSERTSSPMLRADDAHLIDTTEMSIEEAVEMAIGIVAG